MLFQQCLQGQVLNLNVHQGWRTMAEIAIGPGGVTGENRWGFLQARETVLGSEFSFGPHFFVGPKITFNYSVIFLSCGGSLIYYTDLKNNVLCLHPHIGLSANTFADLYVGYNIPLYKNEMKNYINGFTVTLAIPLMKERLLKKKKKSS